MRLVLHVGAIAALLAATAPARAQQITTAGQPAQLDIRSAGSASIRITLAPIRVAGAMPFSPAVAERAYPAPAISLRELAARAAIRTSVQL
jgi:hypothetical protein